MRIAVSKWTAGLITVFGLVLGAVDARATMIDFSVDGNGNPIVAGQIIDSEFAALGLTIDGNNPNRSFDLLIAFDSANPTGGDNDLGTPGTLGNAATASLGNMLILAERNNGSGDGVVDTPDDEGNRPAGTMQFTWATPLKELGFHLIDIESVGEEPFLIDFFSGATLLGTLSFTDLVARDGTVTPGDNSVNWILPITAAEVGGTSFDRVIASFGGSGAIDTLVYEPIPEPSSLILFGAGAALTGIRRYRNRKRAPRLI